MPVSIGFVTHIAGPLPGVMPVPNRSQTNRKAERFARATMNAGLR